MIEAEIDGVNKYSIYKRADIKEPTKEPHENIWVMKISGAQPQQASCPALSLIGGHKVK